MKPSEGKMGRERFDAILLPGHKEAAIRIPFDPTERWGIRSQALWPGRRGYAVRGSLNDYEMESVIVARSRRFFCLVPELLQQMVGLSVGDRVQVEIEPVGDEPDDAKAQASSSTELWSQSKPSGKSAKK